MDHKRKDGQKMSLTKQTQHNILNTTGDNMKVGDLARCIHTDVLLIIVSECDDGGYHDVYALDTGTTWLMPQEHLEVINESR